MAPFRFGVQYSNAGDGPSWRCEARKLEEMGFSYSVLHRGDVEAFAPVVARLAGT